MPLDLHLEKHLLAVVRACPDSAPPSDVVPLSLASYHLWSMYGAAADSSRYESQARAPDMTLIEPGRNGKSIARIQIRDVMLNYRPLFRGTATPDITNAVTRAANDPNISGIMLEIDSPGGMTAGVEALGTAIGDARKRKPVHASIENVGASAAYWAASQADVVYAANKSSLVGSIGTYLSFYDESKAAAGAGVEPLVFSTGPLKGAGQVPGAPITEEQRTFFQGLVNSLQSNFDAAVKSGRAMNQAQLNAVKSGAVFPAAEAIGLKLIDGIQAPAKTLAGLMAAK